MSETDALTKPTRKRKNRSGLHKQNDLKYFGGHDFCQLGLLDEDVVDIMQLAVEKPSTPALALENGHSEVVSPEEPEPHYQNHTLAQIMQLSRQVESLVVAGKQHGLMEVRTVSQDFGAVGDEEMPEPKKRKLNGWTLFRSEVFSRTPRLAGETGAERLRRAHERLEGGVPLKSF